MQLRRHALLSLTLVTFSGCLISEVNEYTLTLNSDGRSGTFRTVRRNVASNESDTAAQRRDFSELVGNWRGDRYLLDQMEKGLYVKSRSVAMEQGKVVWRETAIFSDVTKLIPNFDADDTLRIPLHDTTGLEITSNGTVALERDSVVILWQPHTTHFELTTKLRDFKPVSSFAARLRRYLKK
ncbi:MAG TPA: hypothetical protein VGR15_03695 [Bacteroidota bacterium]|nr:hypothetical protein [Bacteroidota bacterium]